MLLDATFLNSVIVSTCSTLIALVLGLPAAYGLARFPWPRDWSRSISFWILSNRMLPPIVTIIPLFLMLREVHLLNSLTGLMLVDVAFNLPFVVWMMRGFVEELPREIEEAAMLDGESRLGVLLRIVLPLVRPGPRRDRRLLPDRGLERISVRADPLADRIGDDAAGRHRRACHAIRNSMGRHERRRRGRHAAGSDVRRGRAAILRPRPFARGDLRDKMIAPPKQRLCGAPLRACRVGIRADVRYRRGQDESPS